MVFAKVVTFMGAPVAALTVSFLLMTCKRRVNPEYRILNTQIGFVNPSCQSADNFFSQSVACNSLQKINWKINADAGILRSNGKPLGDFTSIQFDFANFPLDGFGPLKKVFQGSMQPFGLQAEIGRVYNLAHFFEWGFQAVLGYTLFGFEFTDTLAPLVGLLQSGRNNLAKGTQISWSSSAIIKDDVLKKMISGDDDEGRPGDLVLVYGPTKGAAPIHYGLLAERGFVFECTPVQNQGNGSPVQKGTLFRMVSVAEFKETAMASQKSASVSNVSTEFKIVYLNNKTEAKISGVENPLRIVQSSLQLSGQNLSVTLSAAKPGRKYGPYEHERSPTARLVPSVSNNSKVQFRAVLATEAPELNKQGAQREADLVPNQK